ncbi:MAG: hypothetical protein Q9216_001474 [Gyalolechia sp. 2 TL-2023]
MPLLSREIDALWQVLCPSFYSFPVLNIQRLPKLAKLVQHRRYHNHGNRAKPDIGRKNIKGALRPTDYSSSPGISQEFFFNGHHVQLDASGQATTRAQDIEQPQHAYDRTKQPWGLRSSSGKEKIHKSSSGVQKQCSDTREAPNDGRGLTNQWGSSAVPREPALQTADLKLASRGFKARHGRSYGDLTEEEIYEEMRRASTAGDYPRVREVLRIIIQDRGEKPNQRHFQASILANISPEHGSATNVIQILQEMEDESITLDSASYHAILRVLSIHPNHLLRRQILEALRQRWFSLSNEGWHDVIAGLLRDKQVELAIETLQSSQQDGICIAPWLYDMFIYNLCDAGEYEEALSILRFRVENGEQLISGTVWYYFLDLASSAFHYPATLYAWRKRVETNYLNPPSGVCLNVLNTAARHGDCHLATDVLRVLGNRMETLQVYHYEALIESYLPSDLRMAFTILTVMTSNGTPPTNSSTRAVFLHLRQSSHLPRTALSILHRLREQGRPIPVEAVNVVIESDIDHGEFDAALETYKTLHTLCPSGPLTSTFNLLLRDCRGRKSVAMFLASEMVALNILPDALTYDRLILVCMEESRDRDEMDDGWRYFEEMRGAGWWPRPGTAMAMAKRSCQIGDERIWRLEGDDGELGIERSVLKRMVEEDWMKEKRSTIRRRPDVFVAAHDPDEEVERSTPKIEGRMTIGALVRAIEPREVAKARNPKINHKVRLISSADQHMHPSYVLRGSPPIEAKFQDVTPLLSLSSASNVKMRKCSTVSATSTLSNAVGDDFHIRRLASGPERESDAFHITNSAMADSVANDHFPLVAVLSSSLLSPLFLLVLSALLLTVYVALRSQKTFQSVYTHLLDYCAFFYTTFLKPHSEVGGSGQQAALESFYKVQANVYDATRQRLLCGREDMLALAAAQLKYQAQRGLWRHSKPIWVDIGGGTGYNIEAMNSFLDIPDFFSAVFLVDLSPSLCAVARERFQRLGWEVKIVCEDARTFRLEDHLEKLTRAKPIPKSPTEYTHANNDMMYKADLVTMSYSLSMIPDYHNVVDSMVRLLAPSGLIGAVDFYVQSIVETTGRNYIGGSFNRHVNWLSRVFWRAWFDCDRVSLEGARRVSFSRDDFILRRQVTNSRQDYLEYRFGTKKIIDQRNYLLGGIPYYIFLGCHYQSAPAQAKKLLETVDASCTESPLLDPAQGHELILPLLPEAAIPVEARSKAYQSAVVNLSSNLPLPSTFYQNHRARIHYDEYLNKHTQFNHDYLYAFTWEDPRTDQRLLQINDNDTVLCLTSAGDNLLDYLVNANPRRIHAVDLNPNQNHLLELKVAAFQALPYVDVWKLFGEGRHPDFRKLLLEKLSPHISSQAFQFWLKHTGRFTSTSFYNYGGSGHAIKLVRWLSWLSGLKGAVRDLCNAKTRNEQREVWSMIRPMILSRTLHWALVGTEWFLWKAAGVPASQRRMIVRDSSDLPNQASANDDRFSDATGEAMWSYIVNTLDPVARDTLLSEDNYHYLLVLTGRYTRRCHPAYLAPKAHTKLSQPKSFSGLRIHTDELNEVIQRFAPAALTIAIIMDSMDWFDPNSTEATNQVRALNRALRFKGRVLLRSAGLRPWYVHVFENHGFSAHRVAARLPGSCVDRVNMYASTWIMTKVGEIE